uniref:Parvin, gamma n=1 Tax=Cyclopterus lumpus TaxID=8103 RepID=A0A8C3ADX3_CYCLU
MHVVNISHTGEKQTFIQPTSLKDPKLEKLKQALVYWINSTLKAEHIVVQSLEEDLYDGLVLHHLLSRLAGVHVSVADIALTSLAQIRKLGLILEQLDKRLGLQDGSRIKWNVKLIHNKDLLATIHLLVAMVRAFQPELDLPQNVTVEVVVVEVSFSLSFSRAILHFVNQNMSSMGLQVADMDTQFADGVILLLLIGQLEGFCVPLCHFNLTPVSPSEMLHNVTLALDLLNDTGLQVSSVDPQGEEMTHTHTLLTQHTHSAVLATE